MALLTTNSHRSEGISMLPNYLYCLLHLQLLVFLIHYQRMVLHEHLYKVQENYLQYTMHMENFYLNRHQHKSFQHLFYDFFSNIDPYEYISDKIFEKSQYFNCLQKCANIRSHLKFIDLKI